MNTYKMITNEHLEGFQYEKKSIKKRKMAFSGLPIDFDFQSKALKCYICQVFKNLGLFEMDLFGLKCLKTKLKEL